MQNKKIIIITNSNEVENLLHHSKFTLLHLLKYSQWSENQNTREKLGIVYLITGKPVMRIHIISRYKTTDRKGTKMLQKLL